MSGQTDMLGVQGRGTTSTTDLLSRKIPRIRRWTDCKALTQDMKGWDSSGELDDKMWA